MARSLPVLAAIWARAPDLVVLLGGQDDFIFWVFHNSYDLNLLWVFHRNGMCPHYFREDPLPADLAGPTCTTPLFGQGEA